MNHITSPRTDDDAIEAEIKAKGKTAPRITPEAIQHTIASCHYFTAADGAYAAALAQGDSVTRDQLVTLGLLTICVLVLANGFTVHGTSACASPENFDAEIGKKIARANAEQQIWALEGYRLRQNLHDLSTPGRSPA